MAALMRMVVEHREQNRDLIRIRCERGAQIAGRLGFSAATADAIHSLDEHWNGGGYPRGLRGAEIPQFARILNLAQTMEVFHRARGREAALEIIRVRMHLWFDPDLVRAAESAGRREEFWSHLNDAECLQAVVAMEPEQQSILVDEGRLNNICAAFAEVIDAKSPFTYRHSNGVADAALGIAGAMSLSGRERVFLWRAALLHDIGKLSVPNTILEKPGKLTDDEWRVVKQHPAHTYTVLKRIPGFEPLAETAAAHHEKLDGSGYFRGWEGDKLTLEARILVVADIFDALAARRPYRDAMALEQVFRILDQDAPRALDADCGEALKSAKQGRDHSADVARLMDALSDGAATPERLPHVVGSRLNVPGSEGVR